MFLAERAEWRFGLGPRAGQAWPDNPRNFLRRQLDEYDPRPAALADAPTPQDVAKTTGDFLEELRQQGLLDNNGRPLRTPQNMTGEEGEQQVSPARTVRRFIRRAGRDFYGKSVNARITAASESETGFAERLVHFWANHFAVSVDKSTVLGFAGLHEFDAIRPNIMGNFSDLLKAAALHPAMLIYLDQAQSIGPDSMAAKRLNRRRRNKLGLNENLAREILELHTLGVQGGYDQKDIVQLAHALTGWTVSGLNRGRLARRLNLDGEYGAPAFAQVLHQPGSVQVLGRKYTQSGARQVLAVLNDLATHPSTARHIAIKLARHFASDDPPSELVARLEQSFLASGGDLKSLYNVLINSTEVWQSAGKYTSPWEWMIAVNRLRPDNALRPRQMFRELRRMGQQPWMPGSPAGFGDKESDWLGPDALYKRIQASRLIAGGALSDIDVSAIAKGLFPDTLSKGTALELGRAESARQAFAMLLVSPEFLRR